MTWSSKLAACSAYFSLVTALAGLVVAIVSHLYWRHILNLKNRAQQNTKYVPDWARIRGIATREVHVTYALVISKNGHITTLDKTGDVEHHLFCNHTTAFCFVNCPHIDQAIMMRYSPNAHIGFRETKSPVFRCPFFEYEIQASRLIDNRKPADICQEASSHE